ncbi:MAG: OmpH family outer membrane protein [Balneolaceae bacterium]
MNRVFWIWILFFPVLAQEVGAQNQRVGYVNTDRILEQMPEYQGIEERLTILGNQWREEAREMELELELLEQDFEERELLYDEELRAEQRARIEQLKGDREAFLHQKFGPDGDYFQQQKALLEPLQQEIYQAIDRAARQDSYDFVLDRAGEPRMLFAREEWDLTDEVLQILGLGTSNESELRN